MNKVILSGYITLAVIILQQLAIYSFSGEPLVNNFELTFLLSIPLFFPISMMTVFCTKSRRNKYPLLSKISIFAFITTSILYLGWNSLMLLNVLQNQTVGPAQGYSGLILWLGSVKTIFLGVCLGLAFHYLKRIVRKSANKSL